VHLRFSRDTLVVGGAAWTSQAEEAAQLARRAERASRRIRRIHRPPSAALVSAPEAPRASPRIRPRPSPGRTLEPFLPQGDEARDWRRLINEAQVLLHNHPLNMAREAAGRPTANSLWPWGAGSLPGRATAPAARIEASHPLAIGLARLSGVPALPTPERFEIAVPGRLTFLQDLELAAQGLDDAAWRTGLTELETRWFAPLLAALKAGNSRACA
jgi:hypothetical protein